MSDVEITLRIRAANLDALVVEPHEAAGSTRAPVYLVEVEPGVYRLGGFAWAPIVPEPISAIDVLREAGVADEVDELFLGGGGRS